MNLALDFGNTLIKAGIFKGGELISAHYFATPAELLNSIDLFSGVQRCILGSVTKQHEDVISLLPKEIEQVIFTQALKIPIEISYESPATLGADRVAAVVGSWLRYPDKNVLTVDAGTCIKYNFVNSANTFTGGAISPGIGMRLDSMHRSTAALPLTTPDINYNSLTGTDTRSSLLSGAQMGAVCEVDAMIDRYRDIWPGLTVSLTGGDAQFLEASLKNRFFAHRNLVLYGLNHILSMNPPHKASGG